MSILARLWNALRPERLNDEVREELETHLALLEEEARAGGLSAREARTEARRRFGNPAAYREKTRGTDLAVWLDTIRQDLAFAARQLLRAPGFTASAVLLLALGIGLNAGIFTLVNSVILRALPLPDAGRLAIVLERMADGGCCSTPSWLDQRDIREQQRSFQSLGAFSYEGSFVLRMHEQTERLLGGYVTPDYFTTLGVKPIAGRLFTAAEAAPGHDDVVLVREDFWKSALGGDPALLAGRLEVNGRSCAVLGVLPAWFRFPWEKAVLWAPLVPSPEAARGRGWHGYPLVGRLRPGVTLRQAGADLDAVVGRLARQYPDAETMRIPIRRGRAFLPGEFAAEATAARVAIVNETLARQLWGASDPRRRGRRVAECRAPGLSDCD